MDNIELKAISRTSTGNGPARVLRREGRIPAILYGPESEPSMLSVDAHEMELLIKGGHVGSAIFNLAIDGGKNARPAMIKEMQMHPVNHNILHIDFYEVSMKRKVKVNVPVVTTGKAAGVEMGGMLQIIRRELEVFCLPNAIPQDITIDITDLEVGDSVHVEDVQVEGDVEIPHEVNFTILTILAPKAAEAEEEEGEEEELEEGEEAAAEEEGEADSEA